MNQIDWFSTSHPAHLEERLADDVVKCHLSPRNCVIKPGKRGFCGVRANQDGRLVTLNYGKSVHATIETIETEAIFHYAPGERILSMGNVGCMLNCDYCHNWKTSQAREVSNEDVHYYSPEEVVDMALRHNIRVISWTYNDPVVWQEFVVDTARLAKEKGIINLYKSAFFISPEAIEELIPVIDIFSISIKSMDPQYYRRLTKGWIEPVLEGTLQVYKAGKHVEVSTLMITDISDNDDTGRSIAEWVLKNMGPDVPAHFVRFHPDYKMTNTIRTPVERLESARLAAKALGMRHIYLGNVYDNDAVNTYCQGCGARQVERYGLNAKLLALNPDGTCTQCGLNANFRLLKEPAKARPSRDSVPDWARTASFEWHGDIRAVHIVMRNETSVPQEVYTRRFGASGQAEAHWDVTPLQPGESHRCIAAKSTPHEIGVQVAVPHGVSSNLHEVFDRAHFPTVPVASGTLNADVTPLPMFKSAAQKRAEAQL